MEMADLEVVLPMGARIHDLKRKIVECKQGSLSIEAYYAKMNTFWQQLDAHFHQRVPNPSHELQKLWEEDKVHQLLMGLDETLFGRVCSALLAMDPLPSLDRVCLILVQEEDRLNPLNLPVEIVEEILMRLNPKSLFMFKGVSTRCKHLVMHPGFARKYMRGMLYPLILSDGPRLPPRVRSSPGCWEVKPSPHVDHRHHQCLIYYVPGNEFRSSRILASSNGLVLSHDMGYFQLCVSNPLTNRYVHLSLQDHGVRQIQWEEWTCGLATRASEAYKIEYKVVFFARPRGWDGSTSLATIKMCSSSDTQRDAWIDVVSEISCPRVVFRNFFHGPASFFTRIHGPDFCYKGILHWIDDSDTRRRIMVTYDPFDQPDRFGHLPLPNVGSRKIVRSMSLSHLDHEESLKFCEIEGSSDHNLDLLVWRLLDYGEGEWRLEQRCRISPLCGDGVLFGKCRQVIAPDPWDPEAGFRYVFARDDRVIAVDLGSGKEEDQDVSEVFLGPQPFDHLPLVPYVDCPWASIPTPIIRFGSLQGYLEEEDSRGGWLVPDQTTDPDLSLCLGVWVFVGVLVFAFVFVSHSFDS